MSRDVDELAGGAGPEPRILAFRGVSPRIAPSALVVPSATVVGDVEIGPEASLWFGVVVRGDVEPVRVGARTNLQDQVVVHVTSGQGPAIIGDEVTVGHRAVVHGCQVEDRSLIGIGAIILDGAVVGAESLVAAGAVVPPRMVVPPRSLVRGVPARVVRTLTTEEVEALQRSAAGYVALIEDYRYGHER